MVVTCDIEFDKNPNCTFRSGQLVNGTVTLETDKARDLKAVLVKLSGFADTNWEETSFGKTNHYGGHVNYLNSVLHLLGSDDAEKCTLQAGKHQYTFAFELPKECPTSFKVVNGRIEYTLAVVLVRPWKLNQTFTKALSVIQEMDLNNEGTQIAKPVYANVEKILWTGLSNSEPSNLGVTLARSGFVPGENISIEVIIANDSSVIVKEIRLSLVMLVKCYERASHVSSTTESKVVSKLKGEGVLNHCKKLFNYELPVHETPPTCIGVCSIIDISYEVHVEAIFKGLHTSQILRLPVTIGTIPLMRNVSEKDPIISKIEDVKGINTKNSNATEVFVNNSEASTSSACVMPPLSYEEAVNLPRAKLNTNEDPEYGQSDPPPPSYAVSNISCTKETNNTN